MSAIDVVAVRAWASEIVTASVLTPGVVIGLTATRALKTLSPAVTSPFVPSSRSRIDGSPPIELALTVTRMFVLGGPSAGVTATVRSVEAPAGTVDARQRPPRSDSLRSSKPPLRGRLRKPRTR
jgi:hypothetical protein